MFYFFFSSRRRHTRSDRDWSSDVCSSDLDKVATTGLVHGLIGILKHRAELVKAESLSYPNGSSACGVAFRTHSFLDKERSEERRVGKECRSRWSPYH